jgi:hypothetical protein
LRSSSTPTTRAQSYRPASISAIAASTAIDEDAQAASWRAAGTPYSSGTTADTIAPRCACPRWSSPKALPTWIVSMRCGSSPQRSIAPTVASRTMSEMSLRSRDQLRAKSVW